MNLSNSPPDNLSTDDIIAIIDYVCGYACKDSEPTGATADLFKDMVNAVDAADADQVTGKSLGPHQDEDKDRGKTR